MIITETYTINNTQFVRTYSDEGRFVVRDGVSYEEANDPASFGRTYTEGEYIPEEATAEELLAILMGEEE